jgi:hypothetical protein
MEIKSLNGKVLFVSDKSYVRAALEEAARAGAYLGGADLRGAYLGGADLRGAYLLGAYLRGAYLRGADLRGAYLRGADLRGADLRGVDLRGVDLRGAIGADLVIARTRILPDEGDVVGWKKARDGLIVKILIKSGVKRSHGSGRKCRAAAAVVLDIYDGEGTAKIATSSWDANFVYAVGETVWPSEPFDEDMWNECASGIHFYITRAEAEAEAH